MMSAYRRAAIVLLNDRKLGRIKPTTEINDFGVIASPNIPTAKLLKRQQVGRWLRYNTARSTK